MACSHWANVPETIRSCVGITDNHHRGDKSWTSTSGDRGNSHAHGYRSYTRYSTTYPGSGASNKIMAVAGPILPPAWSGKCHENQPKRPKTQRIAASPSLFRAWGFWASSPHPREAGRSLLACVAKTKQKLAAAHTQQFTPSLSSTNKRGSQPGDARDATLSRSEKCVDYKYVTRGFPIGRKFVSSHQIEWNSIRFIKWIISIQSVLR